MAPHRTAPHRLWAHCVRHTESDFVCVAPLVGAVLDCTKAEGRLAQRASSLRQNTLSTPRRPLHRSVAVPFCAVLCCAVLCCAVLCCASIARRRCGPHWRSDAPRLSRSFCAAALRCFALHCIELRTIYHRIPIRRARRESSLANSLFVKQQMAEEQRRKSEAQRKPRLRSIE